mmetsp:Transcript_22287/g.48999  ORF Transcript_22287/g.48999 Transcript_22287/m.48999 type:complete len:554 (-) Transcript_22287:397-2058(-)|eukprot:CAMPEP_0118934372 /NCGR_PEP_ID=MMETSP1169-20130426/13789_1 /TAXON_ID=36882 /ORGANISM="Pyramimonas obovata, Strain CCMP722" /LENGTH=553 /DNA_ID=CAMNT_0006877271 /DNA_START=131 /DNA_END=1792 /DNA_ORIENTATION=-
MGTACAMPSPRRLLLSLSLVAFSFGIVKSEVVEWCASTPAHGAVFETRVYEEVCIPLCVQLQEEEVAPTPDTERRHLLQTQTLITVRKTRIDEAAPFEDDAFPYPYDEVNYPPSSGFSGAPAVSPNTNPYCFTPTSAEECSYTMCFEGIAAVDDTSIAPTSTVRCYRVNVVNDVMVFDGNTAAEDDGDISREIKAGFTMSAWVHPTCDEMTNVNKTVMFFGKRKEGNNQVRNGIKWHAKEAVGLGRFYYYDEIGAVESELTYRCGVWHYVAVTIHDEAGTLYVDPVKPEHMLTNSRDMYTNSAVAFNTSSRPDHSKRGRFILGQPDSGSDGDEGFLGMIDEVRVYNTAMTADEIHTDSVTRTLLPSLPASLKGYYTMTGARTPGSRYPHIVQKAIPTMVPCVLGMQHSVGPVDGHCRTEVYGWSFSESVNPQCSIAGVASLGTYVNDNTIACTTPGHLSPQFTTVLASNNGLTFTDPVFVDKTTHHLFMESSLYVQGGAGSNSGASADQVCEDFTAGSQEVTVSVWSCPKCGPPKADAYNPGLLDTPCSKDIC